MWLISRLSADDEQKKNINFPYREGKKNINFYLHVQQHP